MGTPFRVLRRNPKPTFGAALLLQAAVLLVSIVGIGAVTAIAIGRVSAADPADQSAVASGAFVSIALSVLIPVVLNLFASALLQGMIVSEVAHGTLGEKLSLRGLWASTRGRRWALIGWVVMLSVAAILALALVVGIITLLAVVGGTGGIIAAVIVGILFGGGLIVVAAWIIPKVSLVPSAIVLERLGVMASIRRSWRLTNNNFWRTFGIEVLIQAILYAASQAVSTVFSVVFTLVVALLFPTNAIDSNGQTIVLMVSYAVLIMISLVIGSISSIIQSAATALIYIDLRMRKEGLDLYLTRFVETRQAGVETVGNPYATVPSL
jgi:hypothetical protein